MCSKYQIDDKGKYVTIKLDRECDVCHNIIIKGVRCYTKSVVRRVGKKRKRIRIWICPKCPKPKNIL